MYVLHYAPDNASMIVRLALLEIAQPFRTVLVDRSLRAQDSAAYRHLNPTGLVPALETPQGPLFETAAILLWLADRHGGLGPAPKAPDRGDFLKWLFFLSNTAHADLRQLFYPDQYVPDSAIPAHHALLVARMQRHFALLDAAVTTQPALFAPPSALALYTAALMRWSVLYPLGQKPWFDPGAFPALVPMAAGLETRASVLELARAEGLGLHIFTNPRLATPPEGSVL
ncbi:MAG: glutathione S-transferase family protein [Paracoccaceae bacterium]|nr:glutathione S-transferase family protein [Paracoccaceae bacterium]